MKKIVYFLFGLFIISCQNEDNLQVQEVVDSLKVDKKQIIEFELVNDTVLVGREGTKIFVQKNMFKNYNGGLVTLELTEYFDIEEIILNSIETVTNDNGEYFVQLNGEYRNQSRYVRVKQVNLTTPNYLDNTGDPQPQ